MKFTRPDVRDLVQDPSRFVRTRSEAGGSGFSDLYRQALVQAVRAYLDWNHDEAAMLRALDSFVLSGNGPSPRKLLAVRLLRGMLTKYARWDRPARRVAAVYLDARSVRAVWRGHALSMPVDMVVGDGSSLRCIWTDEASRLHRRGTGLVVAACLAHAESRFGAEYSRVEVWHLREVEPRSWGRADLVGHWPALERWLDWAAHELRAA